MNPWPTGLSPQDDAIDTAAAEWLIEREEGFRPDRAAEFAAWRATDPRHEAAVARTEAALGLLAEMPVVRGPLEARLAEETKVVRPAIFRPGVWAAGLAAALTMAGALWWLAPSRGEAIGHYATAPTRQQEIALFDGSVVNLNVSTDLQVVLTPNRRQVTLNAGEAHFAVAHDADRPFVVTAAGVSVRAVGTAFSVRLGHGGVEILVTEGRVAVTRDHPASPPATVLPAGRPLLEAGERTHIARDAAPAVATIERVSADALQDAVRWHSRVMTFSDLPLRDALLLFNRRNVQQLSLAEPALGERKIGGTFAADQVEAFVRLLAQDGDIAVDRPDATRIVLRRAP
ncbi:FecR family protein [Horticoccus sp. 23ND18S-11]|uniref:FecR family protein n=1 Tax=Horticoccus sp. 23ND18S-11 TaxID=3391832 RepID=UPI0039C9E387